MNCCSNCFTDREVIGFIETNSTQKGHCDICQTPNVNLIPASELLDVFQDLILSYSAVDDTHVGAKMLWENLKDWKIFKPTLENAAIQTLVKAIGSSLLKDHADLFDKPTQPNALLTADADQADQYNVTWSNFKEEIKSTNRFFIKNQFEQAKLKDILASYCKNYKKNKLFYRARNSDKDGLTVDKMGKPPAHLTTPGRANPKGISYLYLANDEKTTLYEVRAAIYDYVTVAEFKLKEEINIVSLRHSDRISPFQLDDIDKYLLYEQFVKSLHNDLKKPLRRQDTELEYLPTQYLCELIKFLGYDGVEYSSSMNPDGFNIALFNDEKIECVSTKTYEIESITYKYSILANP